MDIGKSIMEKYGWREGNGLGKAADGIKKAIRPKYKFNKQGFGVNNSEEFANHWWERTFDQASKNVNVEKVGDEVSFSVYNSVKITTKTYSVKKFKKNKPKSRSIYKNFMRASILENNIETPTEKNNVDLEDLKPEIKVLSDDDLLAACGGRTAHKGARHGLSLSGKLTRIEEQDQKLLSKSNSEENTNLEIVEESIKHESVNMVKDNEEADNHEIEGILDTKDYLCSSENNLKEQNKIYNALSSRVRALKIDKRAKRKKKNRKKKTSERDPVHEIKDICIVKPKQSRNSMKKKLKNINISLTRMKF